jgi:hypothetical protein
MFIASQAHLISSVDPLGPTRASWVIEILASSIAVAVAIYFVIQTKRTRSLSVPALLFIGTTTMFWQEFYADWGAYLYYNSDFVQLPWWGQSAYTTPNKPLFVIAGYGWFFAGSFPALLLIVGKVREARPTWPNWVPVAVIVTPLFWAWNLITADGAAYFGRWWNYMSTYGPTLHSARGQLPFLFPGIPFGIYAAITLGIVSAIDDRGQRPFERIARLAPDGSGWRYQVHRAAAWAITMNLCYGLFFVLPVVLVRILFLGDNEIVP